MDDSPRVRLNQTSNFSLDPNKRSHEFNSFYESFNKLNEIKTRLINIEKASRFSFKNSHNTSRNDLRTLQPQTNRSSI